MIAKRESNPSKTARIAGLLYLLLIPIGFFAVMYVPSLVAPNDMTTTISNIITSEFLFRLSMVALFVMNIIAIAIALLLYQLLEPVNKPIAEVMVIFLLLGTGISMLNELNYFAVLTLSRGDASTAFSAEQSQYLVSMFLDMRKYGANIAAIFWGLWLFPLGYLVIKSSFIPKILGILLIIAGVGYVVDSLSMFMIPQYEIALSTFTFVGEIVFPLWLLIKGVRTQEWENPKLRSA